VGPWRLANVEGGVVHFSSWTFRFRSRRDPELHPDHGPEAAVYGDPLHTLTVG
jgi:hypothetical protein